MRWTDIRDRVYDRIDPISAGGEEYRPRVDGIAAGEDMAAHLLCDRGFVPTITTVVPADFARRVLYPTDLREAEDTDFAIRLALAGCHPLAASSPGQFATLGTWAAKRSSIAISTG